MNETIEKLYDTYNESILQSLNHRPRADILNMVEALPVEESRRVALIDQIDRSSLEFSSKAFAVGLHLGLTLMGGWLK